MSGCLRACNPPRKDVEGPRDRSLPVRLRPRSAEQAGAVAGGPERHVIELKHIRYAVAAADHRSFRRAAEALNLKQSNLSRGILQMECRLGVKLFERSKSGVCPTDA